MGVGPPSTARSIAMLADRFNETCAAYGQFAPFPLLYYNTPNQQPRAVSDERT